MYTEQWRYFDSNTRYLRTEVKFFPVIGNHEKGVDVDWYNSHWEAPIGNGYYSLNMLRTGDLIQVQIGSEGEGKKSGIDRGFLAVHHLTVMNFVYDYSLTCFAARLFDRRTPTVYTRQAATH
jgi:hypothetical protein